MSKKDKALLASRPPERRTALAPAGPIRNLWDISRAYEDAARKLAGNRPNGSIEDLPIIFLYRHAVETAIKAVLIQAGEPENDILKRGHKLDLQMADLKRVASRLRLPITSHFESMITLWQENDPDSMRARYPTDKDGNSLQIPNEDRFHLWAFVHEMKQILFEVDALREALETEQERNIVGSTNEDG